MNACEQLRATLEESVGLEPALDRDLREHVAGCPRCRALLVARRAYGAVIERARGALKESATLEGSAWARIREGVDRDAGRRRLRPAWLAVVGLAAVAAAVLLVVVAQPGPERTIEARDPGVAAVEPAPAAGRPEVETAERTALSLAGTTVRTGREARTIDAGGRHRVTLGAGTALAVYEWSGSAVLAELETGSLHAEVDPLAAGERFVLLAGDARVEVVGTAFDLRREVGGTFELLHVSVEHGMVRVLGADGAESWVRGGQSVRVPVAAEAPRLAEAAGEEEAEDAADEPSDELHPAKPSRSRRTGRNGGDQDKDPKVVEIVVPPQVMVPPAGAPSAAESRALLAPVIARIRADRCDEATATIQKLAAARGLDRLPADAFYLIGWCQWQEGKHDAARANFARYRSRAGTPRFSVPTSEQAPLPLPRADQLQR